MRKLIASINMTLDGFCDHTSVEPDEEVHDYYADLLRNAGVILYGRVTYQLMEYWRALVAKPSGEKSLDDFAITMDAVPKVVFSYTLTYLDWASARLAMQSLEAEVTLLKSQPGKDIYIGSPSLIVQLLNHQLVDELQLCIHPVLAGSGRPLFENIIGHRSLQFKQARNLTAGAMIVTYQLTY